MFVSFVCVFGRIFRFANVCLRHNKNNTKDELMQIAFFCTEMREKERKKQDMYVERERE